MKRAAWLAVIVGLICFGFSYKPAGFTDLFGRGWLDHMPKDAREGVNGYFFSQRREPGNQFLGLTEKGESRFKWTAELFWYQATDTTLNLRFPHDRTAVKTAYRVESIPKNQDGFDLKLTLQNDPRNGNRESVYFSKRRWDRRGNDVPTTTEEMMGLDS